MLDRWLTETKFKPSGSENARTHALFKRCRTRSIFRSLHETVSLVVLAQILFRGHVGKYSGNSWKHLQYLTIKFCCHPPSPNCWPLSFLISSVRLAASCGRLSFPPPLAPVCCREAHQSCVIALGGEGDQAKKSSTMWKPFVSKQG